MTITSVLSLWQWLLLAAVPPAIILLYFLKLRRQPLMVPSTFLWNRTIEDLHVNSLWQRLRKSLLLLLQLLLIGLVMLACLKPSWQGEKLAEKRVIFLVDNSASMSATDVAPTRLDIAKDRVGAMIEQMGTGDVAMIVTFQDRAQIIQPFTDNRRLLQRQVEAIQPTQRESDLGEALRVADGLANPGRSSQAGVGDVLVADPLPASLYIFTDGGFKAESEFSLGNLTPHYVPLGVLEPKNVGIVAFRSGRNPRRYEQLQAFARVENFGSEDLEITLRLFLDGEMIDAKSLALEGEAVGGVEFVVPDVNEGSLRLEIAEEDDLMIDNVAYAAVNLPHRGIALCVTPRNDALDLALDTEAARLLADVSFEPPSFLETEDYQRRTASGAYDLVIFDQCVPTEMPSANTWFIGQIPPREGWSFDEKVAGPQVIDVERTHPITQYIEMGNVQFYRGQPVEGPAGRTVLIDTNIGPLMVIAPRDGFEDVVLGSEIVGMDDEGNRYAATDWPRRPSFPMMVNNLLAYLAGDPTGQAIESVRPGEAITIRTMVPVPELLVTDPGKGRHTVSRGFNSAFSFAATQEIGIYEVRLERGDDVMQRFAVNLFDPQESDIRPREHISTRGEDIAGQSEWQTTRRQGWKWLLGGALFVLLLEWYIFNRRVWV